MKKLYVLFFFAITSSFAQQGSLCTDPIVITSLPYTTTDNTANYGDNYDPATTSSPTCSTTSSGNYYHGGNDVIYSYTPTQSGTIKIEMPSAIGWSGLFVYTDCANIGVTYAACSTSTSTGNRTINNFAVTAGQTYYFFLSTWPDPQTMAYTLNVTQLTLNINEFEATQKIGLYPNPVKDKLQIQSNLDITSASIISINGQVIRKVEVKDNTIPMEDLQSGLYIVQLNTANGSILHQKITKL